LVKNVNFQRKENSKSYYNAMFLVLSPKVKQQHKLKKRNKDNHCTIINERRKCLQSKKEDFERKKLLDEKVNSSTCH
jgi:hypothetical protein